MTRTLLALLMAFCLPFQGLGQAVSRIAAPAHFHADVAAQGRGAAPLAHEHHHEHRHDHADATTPGPLIGHHAHALEDDDVIYVADAHDTPSQGGSLAKTPPVDGVLRCEGWQPPPPPPAERVFSAAAGARFSSHVDGPLRRPPRSHALT